jgi:hypothetical protein
MKLFVWDSDVFTDYTSGMAVAIADSVDEARLMLMEKYWGTKAKVDEVLADAEVGDTWPWQGLQAEPDHVVELHEKFACYITGGS